MDTDTRGTTAARVSYDDNGFEGMDARFLEPWNDAEEWDGTKWVAKKTETPPKPAVVMIRGGQTVTRFDSTNKAVEAAKKWSEQIPGKEYVVYQEKASFKVEPKPPVFLRGDVVQATRDTYCRVNNAHCVRQSENIIVSGDSLEWDSFNTRHGGRLLSLNKCDFVKIGHIDLP